MGFKKGNKLWMKRRKFEHSEETKRKISKTKTGVSVKHDRQFTKGFIPWNKSKKGIMPEPWNKGTKGLCKGFTGRHSEESKIQMSKSKKGKPSWNKGKKWSKEHRIKLSLAKTKEKEFTGFRNKLVRQIRLLVEYVVWRRLVFERDNYTCQDCLQRGKYIEAHHIKPFHQILVEKNIKNLEEAKDCQELWMVSNGITYCRGCHIKNDKFIGRRKICAQIQF